MIGNILCKTNNDKRSHLISHPKHTQPSVLALNFFILERR